MDGALRFLPFVASGVARSKSLSDNDLRFNLSFHRFGTGNCSFTPTFPWSRLLSMAFCELTVRLGPPAAA